MGGGDCGTSPLWKTEENPPLLKSERMSPLAIGDLKMILVVENEFESFKFEL